MFILEKEIEDRFVLDTKQYAENLISVMLLAQRCSNDSKYIIDKISPLLKHPENKIPLNEELEKLKQELIRKYLSEELKPCEHEFKDFVDEDPEFLVCGKCGAEKYHP